MQFQNEERLSKMEIQNKDIKKISDCLQKLSTNLDNLLNNAKNQSTSGVLHYRPIIPSRYKHVSSSNEMETLIYRFDDIAAGVDNLAKICQNQAVFTGDYSGLENSIKELSSAIKELSKKLK